MSCVRHTVVLSNNLGETATNADDELMKVYDISIVQLFLMSCVRHTVVLWNNNPPDNVQSVTTDTAGSTVGDSTIVSKLGVAQSVAVIRGIHYYP